MSFPQDVVKELTALQEFINVPPKAFELAKNEKLLLDYDKNGMSVSDCADLLIMHASIK